MSEDQEVAHALGMSKAAFSYRKRNADFPEEKLISLKAKFPELDLQYVLFGERMERATRDEHDQFMRAAKALGVRPTAAAMAIAEGKERLRRQRIEALDHPLVSSLIDALAWCDDDAVELLVRIAARCRGPEPLPLGERPAALKDLEDPGRIPSAVSPRRAK